MTQFFENLDLDNFWENSAYAKKEYVGADLTPLMIQTAEKEMGYKLPASYLAMLKSQNGGMPKNVNAPTAEPTSWADDHVAITGIFGLDKTKTYSLLGSLGSEFMKSAWGYPDIGVYVCNCPSAGHDMIALDYTDCGRDGEPRVVHVDQEFDYKITYLAQNFTEFIEGLLPDEFFDDDSLDEVAFLWRPESISFELTKSYWGLLLVLNQELVAGETGWKQAGFRVPENWEDASVGMINDRIQIEAQDKTYYLNKGNHGELSYAILEAGEISDEELEAIWNRIAIDN